MVNEIKIVFEDLPYPELLPNHHKTNFWAVRARFSRIANEEAYLIATDIVNRTPGFKTFERCEVEEVFIVPDMKRRDIEGLITAVKPWIDGCVSAGIVVDDEWKHLCKISGSINYEKGCRRTKITFKEVQ